MLNMPREDAENVDRAVALWASSGEGIVIASEGGVFLLFVGAHEVISSPALGESQSAVRHYVPIERRLGARRLGACSPELHFRVSENGAHAPKLCGDPPELHFRVSETDAHAPKLCGDPPELYFRVSETGACVRSLRAPPHNLQKRAYLLRELASGDRSPEHALHGPPRVRPDHASEPRSWGAEPQTRNRERRFRPADPDFRQTSASGSNPFAHFQKIDIRPHAFLVRKGEFRIGAELSV
jgi:hypothetical protein